MGYLSIPLKAETRKLLNVIMPFGVFKYPVLPMGIKPATDIFPSRMVSIFSLM